MTKACVRSGKFLLNIVVTFCERECYEKTIRVGCPLVDNYRYYTWLAKSLEEEMNLYSMCLGYGLCLTGTNMRS